MNISGKSETTAISLFQPVSEIEKDILEWTERGTMWRRRPLVSKTSHKRRPWSRRSDQAGLTGTLDSLTFNEPEEASALLLSPDSSCS